MLFFIIYRKQELYIMNTQIFKKIKFCRTFEDLCKIIKINSNNLNHHQNIEIINYEYLFYSHNEISGLYQSTINNSLIYKISNCNIGLLNFNSYIPETLRSEIINNINSKIFFEQMNNIMFLQYMKFIHLKYNQKIWFNLIYKLLNIDFNNIKNNSFLNKRSIYSSKSTFNVRQQSLLDNINNFIDININEAKIERQHIFKINKKIIPYLGIFKLGYNTIGSHYYTSMCLFIHLKLTSYKYNNFIKNINKIFKNLSLQSPEFKIVFVINILDADNLNFILGQSLLSLSSFIIIRNIDYQNLFNIIFE